MISRLMTQEERLELRLREDLYYAGGYPSPKEFGPMTFGSCGTLESAGWETEKPLAQCYICGRFHYAGDPIYYVTFESEHGRIRRYACTTEDSCIEYIESKPFREAVK